MIRGILGILALAAVAGCGDNTRACGAGTEEDARGFCVPTRAQPPMCTAGTMLDPATNTCVIDPSACQDGTVLINGHCEDPTTGLTTDVEEGAEPNGFGLGGERSLIPAGLFTLKAIGGPGVVIHGHIMPRPDTNDDGQPDPDYDTYLVDAPGPALLRITADGVHGISAGFLAVTSADHLDTWVRYGVNLTGDTTKRQVYLPSAGRYAIAIADSRSLVLGAAVGDPTSEYYVTIEQLAIPTAESLVLTAGAVTKTDTLGPEDTRFFTAPMGTGLDEVSLTTEAPTSTGGLVVSVGTSASGSSDEAKSNTGTTPATLEVGGIDAGDTTLIVVEPQINTAAAPTSFELVIRSHDAVALSTTGGTATAANPSTSPSALGDLAQFSFDAAAAGDLIGIDLAWSTPIDGVLLDEHGAIVSAFSWDAQFAGVFGFFGGFGSSTWGGYRGLFRAPQAGRYYLAVYDPFGTTSEPLTATSRVTTLTPAPLAFGTPLVGTAPNAFNSVPFDYAGNAEAWQATTITADAASGGATVQLFDAATTSGRLDALVLEDQGGAGPTTDPGDGIAVVRASASAGGRAAGGRIMLGQPQHLIAKVTTIAAAGTFDLGVAARAYSDEGTHNSGVITHAIENVDPITGFKRYLVRTSPGNVVTVTLHPTGPTLDAKIESLAANETTLAVADAGTAGADETLAIVADARGYVAIQIDAVTGLDSYNIQIAIDAPYYSTHVGSTAWSNACTGGTDVTPADRDDGFTGPLSLPAGFAFFGAPVTAIKISTNGWFTFDTATAVAASASRNERQLPSVATPSSLVAAYWDDLDQVKICTKAIGTTYIVQWRGVLFGDPSVTVAVQAILDTAADSIEIVQAPYTEGTGTSASAGVENAGGTAGTSVYFHANAVSPGTSTKLTHP